jgi:hypothetical protein
VKLRAPKVIGIINSILAGLGAVQLLINIAGYYNLPSSFIGEYGSFMKDRFPEMVIISAILLPLLALSGILLLRGSKYSIALSNAFFVFETVVVIACIVRWKMPFLPFSPLMIAVGLMNGAIALQIVTLYPVIALIFLNRRPEFRMS